MLPISHAHPPDWTHLAQTLSTLPLPVAIVDLETTGGHAAHDRITEIAILRLEHGQWQRHQWLVNPQQAISAFITKLTGISNEMVATAPTFDALAATLLPLLRGHILVAHNSRFDYTFLRREFARAGLAFATPTLCTVQFSRKLYPQHFKHNLDSIIDRFHIPIAAAERHRAMGDVNALTQFLSLSLRDQGAPAWLEHWQRLVKPDYLPQWLPQNLRDQVYGLSDSPGLTVWQHPGHATTDVYTHEQTFSEVCQMMRAEGAIDRWQHAQSIHFYPAAGLLHAHWLKGRQDLLSAAAPAAAQAFGTWHTVQFIPNHQGQLQAHIVALESGILTAPPYGLFAHPKGAKRALNDWALHFGLCPTVLAITPKSLGKHQPCPRQAAGLCDGHCRHDDAVATHNRQVHTHAPLLPVTDWGQWHEIAITEIAELHPEPVTLTGQAGSLKLDESHWYFHPSLPKLFKSHLKRRSGVHFIR